VLRAVAGVFVVALGELARFELEVPGEVRSDIRYEVVDEQVVVDLGVGASVPAGALVVLGDAELPRA
jgi:hypothetical protein